MPNHCENDLYVTGPESEWHTDDYTGNRGG